MDRSLQRLLPPAIALLASAMGAITIPSTARAAEQAMRLSLAIDLHRQARAQAHGESGQMQLKQHAEFAITLVSDGTPMVNNPLDPADPARQLARAQRTQQRVQAAQARVQAAGGRVSGAPVPDMQALQAQAQRLMAQCGNNRDCLMREASRLSAQQVASANRPGGDPALAGRLQAYGAAVRECERVAAGAKRKACEDRARVAAGGDADDPADADEVVETPYLVFQAQDDCKPTGRLVIDERIEGSFADVQGQVPFTDTRQADDSRTVAAFPCGMQMAVLDTRNGRLWVGHALVDVHAQIVSQRVERGRKPQRNVGPGPLQWHEAGTWLSERLSNLNRAGSADTELPAAGGGTTQVKMNWAWQPAAAGSR